MRSLKSKNLILRDDLNYVKSDTVTQRLFTGLGLNHPNGDLLTIYKDSLSMGNLVVMMVKEGTSYGRVDFEDCMHRHGLGNAARS
ncbi:hypothetical protein [Absidia glauca]|uniref:Uncharacterized protein n=1 Tax=Absidia glauca TaxID=4829 RepID=A0A163JNG7_ABSGL|nr:hypothetical protein [Absidia glauca]